MAASRRQPSCPMVSARAARAAWWSGVGHLQPAVCSGPSTPSTHSPQPLRGDDGERLQSVAQRFTDHLDAVQSPHRRKNERIRPSPPPRLDELAVAAPREQGLEEQRLRRPSNPSGAKFIEDRGIKPRICQLQAPDIFPVQVR